MPIVSLIDRLLVWDARMYMLNLSRLIESADSKGDCSADSHQMYIPVSRTNGRSIRNMIGVVMNHLVGMGL